MVDMSKRRKRFLKKFRQSMEIHTHRLFQEMLDQKGYEVLSYCYNLYHLLFF